MTNEEKQLLLKDLSVRLSYGVICKVTHKEDGQWKTEDMKLSGVFNDNSQQYFTCEGGSAYSSDFKPYLRPMSSMTEEEENEYESFIFTQHHEWDGHGTSTQYVETDDVERYVTWLNKNHFDWRGLIPMGLALEASEDMYKF